MSYLRWRANIAGSWACGSDVYIAVAPYDLKISKSNADEPTFLAKAKRRASGVPLKLELLSDCSLRHIEAIPTRTSNFYTPTSLAALPNFGPS